MTMNKSSIAILLAGLLIPVCSGFAQTTIINEQFADGNRTTATQAGGTYTSLDWFDSSTDSLSATAGSMTIAVPQASAAARHAVAHFGSVSLNNVGDSITLSFNVSFTGITSASTSAVAFRFGLFNNDVAGGYNYTADGQDPASDAQGYTVRTSPYNSLTQSQARLGTANDSLMTVFGATGNTTSYDYSSKIPHLLNNSVYAMSLTITLTAVDTVQLGFSIFDTANQVSTSFSGTSSLLTEDRAYTSFDTIAFSASDSGATGTGIDSATISNITLTAIPEPSSYAALLGLTSLGVVACRRSRSRRTNK